MRLHLFFLALSSAILLCTAAKPQTYKIIFSDKINLDELAQRVTIDIVDPSDGNKYTCIIPEAPPAVDESTSLLVSLLKEKC